MADDKPELECDCCGACCSTFQVLASAQDALNEPRIGAEAIELPEHKRNARHRFQLYPLPFHESCCFLGKDKRCMIYETRPGVCRRFVAGSPECNMARKVFGLGPLGEPDKKKEEPEH